MKNINQNLNSNLNYIKKTIGNSEDLKIRNLKLNNIMIACVYLDSLCSGDRINQFILKSINLEIKSKSIVDHVVDTLNNSITGNNVKILNTYEELTYHLLSGFSCILIDEAELFICVETRTVLDRSIGEPTSESVIRGSKDGFTENYMTNVGLIRKRLRDENLWFDTVILGKRTKTKVSIAYIKDIADYKKIDRIKEKLNYINIDGILDSGYIKELIDDQNSIFPKILSTERPDLVSMSLLEGKIAILVENSPFVLILPAVLSSFLHNPEDYYQKPSNASFTRVIRFIAFFLTILTPAIYIAAMTFDTFLIPEELLLTLTSQRQGVPYPTAFEVIVLGIIFEIIRECDIRIPSSMGTSISIVGGLVLGDAAVSANIVSPVVVLVVAITSISNLLFTDIDFINAIRAWRFIFIFFAMIAGLTGIVVAGILFITKLASLQCLGTPYLAPLSPFIISEQSDNIIVRRRDKIKKRASFLTKRNINRMADKNEN